MNRFEFRTEKESDSTVEVFTKVIKAGRRTYYFDVKATRNDDYYVTITESRKKLEQDGKVYFDKQKLHLYKEDFDKFSTGLLEVIEYIKTAKPELFTTSVEKGIIPENNDDIVEFTATSPLPSSSIDEEFDQL